ncbi:MAG TPA: translation elongation factor 4, partial [Trebonia sp.]
DDAIAISAKTGENVREVLEAIVARIPPPRPRETDKLQALIIDSWFDNYLGVVSLVRVMLGEVRPRDKLLVMSTGRAHEVLEVGVFTPKRKKLDRLGAGEVGFVCASIKDVHGAPVGDTLTLANDPAPKPLPGFQQMQPRVFAGLFPVNADDFPALREALDKLRLNDAALFFEPESSEAMGFGFRCGFLGMLHMEIVQERLEREYGLELLATAPSVEYQVTKTNGQELVIDNPAELPSPQEIAEIREPWVDISIITPGRYIGAVMELVTGNRGVFKKMEYLDHGAGGDGSGPTGADARVLLEYRIPLAEILVDFYDQLKSGTQGYASLDYHIAGYEPAHLVKLDILVNGVPVDALSLITHSEGASRQGRVLVEKLRGIIPRQMFDVPIQAAINGRVVARETIRAMRKNVLAKCYGGDITRKRKLLERQKEGKKRMKTIGRVEVPQEAFVAALSTTQPDSRAK